MSKKEIETGMGTNPIPCLATHLPRDGNFQTLPNILIKLDINSFARKYFRRQNGVGGSAPLAS